MTQRMRFLSGAYPLADLWTTRECFGSSA